MPFTPLRARAEKVATPEEKVPEVPPAAMEPPVPEAMDALAAARVDRGDHVAAGVLDLDHGLGGEGRAGVRGARGLGGDDQLGGCAGGDGDVDEAAVVRPSPVKVRV